jgi:iron complex transport system ATP-binding protein
VLAQETPILLLDEPTTFLDIAHQIELMDLLADLNAAGRTIVAVLHDLNQACRYATHLIAMKDGAIIAEGHPSAIITEQLVEEVFGLSSVIIADPVSGTPLIVPKRRGNTGLNQLDKVEQIEIGGRMPESFTESGPLVRHSLCSNQMGGGLHE